MSDILSKKTYQEINDFKRMATARLANSDLKKENKLISCICDLIGNPMTSELGSLFFLNAKYSKEQKQIYRKYASVDKDGNILKDANNNYVYTKKTEEACEKEIEELANKEIEFEPSYCPESDLPKDLIPAEKQFYKGFVIE